MGGYNLLAFGDFYQIPFSPANASLGIPPLERKTEAAEGTMNLPWADGKLSYFFLDVMVQKRIEVWWCVSMANECRNGNMS